MRYREESGGQEHSYLSLCRFLSSISCFQSQLTYFPMYRLAEVEVAALYPRIREVTPNCRYQGCFKITDNVERCSASEPTILSYATDTDNHGEMTTQRVDHVAS
ncbi:hypothetical protein T03_1059 [Trichinella britovi]|uniref:Uncharacterized protein n=1 Tax=Trichinella britovi TaxID=45882 RepID=A0A0V1D0N2_TRIBR|nr:hypothetical protein T03_1059 [Trichinella britovi]